MALSVGSLLAGRYEIVAPIAIGGMGEVWRARDRVLDRIVAAKVLSSEYMSDPSFLARFRNEARHTAALTHPEHRLGLRLRRDHGRHRHPAAGVPRHGVRRGPPARDDPARRAPAAGGLDAARARQSADGLSAAHKAGVVHRDIKPGNLMVRPDGVVKLTDFGIAQARDAAPLTRTGMVVGTAQYLSPEQAQGMEVTAASDVYSLGVVAYECLSGERPFDGASQVAIALAHINRPPPPLPADVPPAVRLLVERALAKDAADRFPDGARLRRRPSGASPRWRARGRCPGPATAPTQVVDGGLADARTQVLAATGATAVAGAGALGPAPGPARPMPPLARARRTTTTPGARTTSRTTTAAVAGSAGRLLAARPRPAAAARRWRLLPADQRQPRPRRHADPTPATTTRRCRPGSSSTRASTSAGRSTSPGRAGGSWGSSWPGIARRRLAELEALGREFDAGAVVRLDPADHDRAAGESTITVYWTAEAYAPDEGEEQPSPRSSRRPRPPPRARRPPPPASADADDGGDQLDGRGRRPPSAGPRRRRTEPSPTPTDGGSAAIEEPTG